MIEAVVPIRPSPHKVLPDTESEGISTQRWLASLSDRVALEAAKEEAAHIVAVAIGDERSKNALRAALRAGADDAVHVSYDPIEDPLGKKYGKVLAKTIQREQPDLVFMGDDAPIMGIEVPVTAARLLDWRSITGVTAIGEENVAGEHQAGDDMLVQRRIDIGKQEIVALETPAILGIDRSYANPTRGSMEEAIEAQQKPIPQYDLEEIAPGETRFSMSVGSLNRKTIEAYDRAGYGAPPNSGSVEERIHRVMGQGSGAKQGAGELIEGSPTEAAEQVVEYLATHELI
jgi:electron transfer flavoprotein beta subunit